MPYRSDPEAPKKRRFCGSTRSTTPEERAKPHPSPTLSSPLVPGAPTANTFGRNRALGDQIGISAHSTRKEVLRHDFGPTLLHLPRARPRRLLFGREPRRPSGRRRHVFRGLRERRRGRWTAPGAEHRQVVRKRRRRLPERRRLPASSSTVPEPGWSSARPTSPRSKAWSPNTTRRKTHWARRPAAPGACRPRRRSRAFKASAWAPRSDLPGPTAA